MNGKYLTLIGTALTLALTSNVALGQSSKFETAQSGGQSGGQSTRSPGEVKLSPRVDKKKFCTDFPLNSRCQGEAASTPSSSGSSSETEKKPADGSTAIPGKGPADTGTTGNPNGSIDVAPPPAGNPSVPGSGSQQQTLPSGTGDTQTSPPGGTTGSPDSAAPGGSNVPGTAPTEPTTPGGTPGGVAPLPPGSTTLPGGATDQTAPGTITDPTSSPSQGPGSGTTNPSSGGSK